jgi:hypothetical protein
MKGEKGWEEDETEREEHKIWREKMSP